MISLAALVIDRASAGLDYDIDSVPARQWAIYYDELAPLCPSRIAPQEGRDYNRQRNALRIEIVPSSSRCALRSPDGRGLAWLLSGGSPISYGACCVAGCPRAHRR